MSCNDAVDPEVEFPETMKQIQGRLPSDEILSRTTADQIDDLGGIVVPKLNWSAPTDVIWLSPDRKLKCSSAEEAGHGKSPSITSVVAGCVVSEEL